PVGPVELVARRSGDDDTSEPVPEAEGGEGDGVEAAVDDHDWLEVSGAAEPEQAEQPWQALLERGRGRSGFVAGNADDGDPAPRPDGEKDPAKPGSRGLCGDPGAV